MRTVSKIIYYGALTFIVVYLLLLILFKLLPLEFANESLNEDFTEGFLFSLPPAVLLLLSRIGFARTWDSNHRKNWALGTVAVAIVLFFILVLYAFSTALSLCSLTTDRTLFKSKTNNSIIVEKSFGCGAVDSTPATRSTYKVKRVLWFLNYTTEIDISRIDKNEWIEVDE